MKATVTIDYLFDSITDIDNYCLNNKCEFELFWIKSLDDGNR